jgi:hypothetical protein
MSLFCRVAFLTVLAAPAMAAPVQCPPTLSVTQTAGTLPAGMQALDAEPKHNWTGVQFSDGHPKDQGWLAPDSSKPSGKTFTNVWTFGASAAGNWIACGYTGTSMVVFWRLPDAVKTCSVKFDSGVSPPSATGIDCR